MTDTLPDSCDTPPPSVTTFTASSPQVYNVSSFAQLNNGDEVEWDWYEPDGTFYAYATYDVNGSGAGCLWSWLQVAGYDVASIPGTWSVDIFYNGMFLTSNQFTILGGGGGGNGSGSMCRNELSFFFAGTQFLGTAWVRPLGPGGMTPDVITTMRADLSAAASAVAAVPCISFDPARFSTLSDALPGMGPVQASQAVQKLIVDVQAAVGAAALTCDNAVLLPDLYVVAVHLGAAAGRASYFVCNAMPADIVADVQAHMETALASMTAYESCASTVNLSAFSAIPFNPLRPYDTYTAIIGLSEQVLWAVSLSNCCCSCGN